MRFDDAASEHEPEAEPARRAIPASIHAEERLEETLLIVRADADPLVLDRSGYLKPSGSALRLCAGIVSDC